jgi:hypothetical protein
MEKRGNTSVTPTPWVGLARAFVSLLHWLKPLSTRLSWRFASLPLSPPVEVTSGTEDCDI